MLRDTITGGNGRVMTLEWGRIPPQFRLSSRAKTALKRYASDSHYPSIGGFPVLAARRENSEAQLPSLGSERSLAAKFFPGDHA